MPALMALSSSYDELLDYTQFTSVVLLSPRK